jgi:hypothetical protein
MTPGPSRGHDDRRQFGGLGRGVASIVGSAIEANQLAAKNFELAVRAAPAGHTRNVSSSQVALGREDLRGCLHALILKLVSRTLKDVDGWDVRNSEPLVALVQLIEPNRYQTSPKAALEAVLVRAAALLEDTNVWLTTDTRIALAPFVQRLFGQEEVVVRHQGKRYDQLIMDIQQESGVPHWSDELRNILTAGIRDCVAGVLYEIYLQAVEHVASSTAVQEVGRPELLAKILASAETGRPVALFGLSGNGKTVLAHRALEHLADGSATTAVIRGVFSDDSAFFALDVHRALAEYGFENASWSLEQNLMRFMQLLRTPGAYACILLDDVDLPTAHLLASDAAVPMLMTSRSRLPFESLDSIAIDAMERNEALALLAGLLPEPAQSRELDAVCAHLGDRPLPIYLTGKLIAAGLQNLSQMLDAFERSTMRALDAAEALVGERVNRPTIEVYRTLVTYCSGVDRLARVVDVLAWMTGASHRVLFDEVACGPAESRLTALEVAAALRELDDLGLIKAGVNELECNTLTLKILRELLLHHAQESLAEIYDRTMARGVADAQRAFEDHDTSAPEEDSRPREGAFLNMLYGQVYEYEFARLLIRPGRLYGGIALSRKNWLLWQRNGELFEIDQSAADELAFCLAAIEDMGIYFWHSGGSYPAQGESLRKFYVESLFHRDRAYDEIRWRQGPEGVLRIDEEERTYAAANVWNPDSDAPPPVPGTHRTLMWSPGPSNQAGALKHKLLSAIPRTLLWPLNVPTWTRCGLLMSPQNQSPAPTDFDCPVCMSDLKEYKEWRDIGIMAGVREMVAGLETGTRWWVKAMIHDVGASIASDREERSSHINAGIEALAVPLDDDDARMAAAFAVRFAGALHLDLLFARLQSLDDQQSLAQDLWQEIGTQNPEQFAQEPWEYWSQVARNWAAVGRSDEAHEALDRAERRAAHRPDSQRPDFDLLRNGLVDIASNSPVKRSAT